MIDKILFVYRAISILPFYLSYRISPNLEFEGDIDVWAIWKSVKGDSRYRLLVSLFKYREFRNVAYWRYSNKVLVYFSKLLLPQMSLCFINTPSCSVGRGLMLQHAFSTIINAKRIGRNVKIYQQVTIGINGEQKPIIGDNVVICAGAKVIGNCAIGNNVIIGANAVVVKDVSDNTVVGGVPAKIISSISEDNISRYSQHFNNEMR